MHCIILTVSAGCSRCKRRRIKCDEALPHCNQCTRRDYECPGYKRPLKWSSKYEIGASGDISRRNASSRSPPTAPYADMPPEVQMATPPSIPTPTSDLLSLEPDTSTLPAPGAMEIGDGVGIPSVTTTSQCSLLPYFDDITLAPLDTRPTEQLHGAQTYNDTDLNWIDWTHISIPAPIEDQETTIKHHYFIQVCRINSCVDSNSNFLRRELSGMMASSVLVYHCVLSMSAAHLAAAKGETRTLASDCRSKALSSFNAEIARLKEQSHVSRAPSLIPSEALMGCILIGMTDSWHNPSFLGTTHLHGARLLFRRLMAQSDTPGSPRQSVRFMIGLMAYWEALASFITNQSLDATSYLDPYCNDKETAQIKPNPWTGVCTPLFIYLAQTGALVRQRLLLRHLTTSTTAGEIGNQMRVHLLHSAQRVESDILRYQAPKSDVIEDTADPVTPTLHLLRLAQIYRLATLVELYRNFPELVSSTDNQERTGLTPREKILAIATSVLALVKAIPLTSGVNCLLTIPLLIVGSTLQSEKHEMARRETGRQPSWNIICTEIHAIASQDDVLLQSKDFVRSRLQNIRQYVGLESVSRAVEILEKVWARSDLQLAIHGESEGPREFVQWTEVMVEEKLETVFG
ncbi:Zn(II)2Cys6 transcription factor [Aspergillus stella-maris]|uniref:Zn(II)2Cys6 transcription factor n=1 Tax=Aspergillus stella-maris TaxID=1810926 RepID=UPI003CCDDC9B